MKSEAEGQKHEEILTEQEYQNNGISFSTEETQARAEVKKLPAQTGSGHCFFSLPFRFSFDVFSLFFTDFLSQQFH